MDTIGNVVVPEDRVRGLESATPRTRSAGASTALSQAWDDELECSATRVPAPVRWLNNRVG